MTWHDPCAYAGARLRVVVDYVVLLGWYRALIASIAAALVNAVGVGMRNFRCIGTGMKLVSPFICTALVIDRSSV